MFSENKDADQLCSYCLCFRLCILLGFLYGGSYLKRLLLLAPAIVITICPIHTVHRKLAGALIVTQAPKLEQNIKHLHNMLEFKR